MEIKVVSVTKTELGKKRMPSQFSELIRPDIIQRAVEAIQSNRRQPYGATPTAGKRASAKLSRRRRDFKTSYGIGISRVPRKIMSRSGTRFNWQAAFAPGAVGGRRSHPPKAEKIWKKKINVQERRKAIRSAMSATVVKELVQKRGHVVPEKYPFIVESRIESLQKTKQAIECLEKLGLAEELARASEKRVRAGIGKMRGRRYNTKKGPLIVVSGNCPLLKSAALLGQGLMGAPPLPVAKHPRAHRRQD